MRRGLVQIPRSPATGALGAVLAGALWLSPARAEPASYAVDPAQSRVRVELGRAGFLKMLGHDHVLEAPLAEGRVLGDLAEIGLARVTLRFEARRLAVVPGTEPEKDVAEVEARMRGPEVLEVDRHPDIAFASTSVTTVGPEAKLSGAVGGEARRLRVRGTLAVKGRAAAIEVPLEARVLPDGLLARGEVELSLRSLGIEPPSVAGVIKVADRFKVSFEIHARAASGPGSGR